jgi:hypothetical protein
MNHARGRAVLAVFAIGLFAAAIPLRAQEKAATDEKSGIPLKIQVVLSEFDGTKKVSSLPYVFYVNADEPRDNRRPTSIRFGLRVPVATGSSSSGNSQAASHLVTQFQYMDVGTNIDCSATTTADNRFKLEISIDRSSLYSSAGDKHEEAGSGVGISSGNPITQHFNSAYHLIVRDGQAVEATTTTNPISGRLLVVSVTATVVKEAK